MTPSIWSKTAPSEPGHYWWRPNSDSPNVPEVVCVDVGTRNPERLFMWTAGVEGGQELFGEWGPRCVLPVAPLVEVSGYHHVASGKTYRAVVVPVEEILP